MHFIVWGGFIVLILILIFIDLGLFHRENKAMTVKSALLWTSIWIALAMLFNGFVFCLYEYAWLGWNLQAAERIDGIEACIQYLTGYLLEKSLSVDNIFVIAMIFGSFKVPAELQHRVLFWGIIGALILRGIMIVLGAALIQEFEWLLYILGLLLIASAIKMLVTDHTGIHPEGNLAVRLAKRIYPVSDGFDGQKFFTIQNGRKAITPLFLALILVETTDVMFAIDSIPVIFGVTRDPYIVFTSNVFALLGLRSMFFILAGMLNKFKYLRLSLIFILIIIGASMLLHGFMDIPNLYKLGIILGILSCGLTASYFCDRRELPTAKLLDNRI